MNVCCLRLAYAMLLFTSATTAFTNLAVAQRPPFLPLYAQSRDNRDDPMQDIRSMSVSEIKQELTRSNVSFADLFEKEGLVMRLHQARNKPTQSKATSTSTTTSTASSTTGPTATTTDTTPSNTADVLQVPLYFTSLDQDVRVAAVNVKDGGLTIQSAEQPYPTIRIDVPDAKQPEKSFTLTLLLDTACSGFVLRPDIVKKYKLPSYNTPVTMTGAGGVSGTTGLSQLDRFKLGGSTFGPLPAAVQDIGALPKQLDGIIGLSFLNQFAGMEMDFCNGKVTFYRKALPPIGTEQTVLAESTMEMVPKLGIYTCPVLLGGRGPVKMLVDTGAASSFINWQGVTDLGLDRSSPAISRIPGAMGAMGSDNMAIELTHRIGVSSTLNLGRSLASTTTTTTTYPGLPLQDARLQIDIGQIPILDSLRADGVSGILGIDALMRCASVRLSFKGERRLTLLN